MSFDNAASALSAALTILPATQHIEVSTGLIVFALAAVWLWRS